MSLLHASLYDAKGPVAIASADDYPGILTVAEDLADRLLAPGAPESDSVRKQGYAAFARRGGRDDAYRAVVVCEPSSSSSRAMQLMLTEMLTRAPALENSSLGDASSALADLAVKYVGSSVASTLARAEAVSAGLGAVKEEAVQTIAGLLERGENLNALAGSAEALESQARDFRRGAARVQRRKWNDTFQTYAVCIAVAATVSLVIAWALFM